MRSPALRRWLLAASIVVSHSANLPGSPDDPPSVWLGTWALNVARSDYPGTFPYKRATRRIVGAADGRLTIVDDMVRVRGGVLHLEWTGRFDGFDYPVQGVDVVLTAAYRRIDDRTCELIQKIDGQVTVTATLAISPDGRQLTSMSTGGGAVASSVYERQ